MRILKCYYCSCNVWPGHGMTFIRNDGRAFTFCSSKCKTHFKARHNPKKSKWTKAGRAIRGKDLIVDPVFQFEKRRNAPVKYNRDLYIKTIQAMKRIEEIKQKRRLRFYLMRMRAAQDTHLMAKKAHLAKEHCQRLLSLHQKDVKERQAAFQKYKEAKLLKQRQAIAQQLVEMN
eukprot:Protomagalhaensia_wolfi_Nauph_80__3343@NODE_33_length_4594_cov_158_586169_g26_i0_p3_GENE_NODE_33_length_4594_cov_158_586169_g26_i0NODE_33_length_4594_cov_158_586169_g26_i0_p3_ORF_typecomplete_len174_score39_49Ribosomal_L24e/PF01246_20/4_9e24Ribosomal_L24e/PF01246_20/4_1e03YHS/PF04945_13/0_0017Metallothio_Pro/PF02069_16/0_16Metallothio_Pro/PF02069_16/6_3e03zfFCS/PF06467_14/0_48zfFCS/PF06467_14/1_1e04_NODE_33_length_4594_cov_158_586169_g26_i010651586